MILNKITSSYSQKLTSPTLPCISFSDWLEYVHYTLRKKLLKTIEGTAEAVFRLVTIPACDAGSYGRREIKLLYVKVS